MSDTLRKLVNDIIKKYSKEDYENKGRKIASDSLTIFINEVNKSPQKTEYESLLVNSAQEIIKKLEGHQ
jgi:hypothetical protein